MRQTVARTRTVDRVRHGHWAQAEPPSRARPAAIGTSPPLGEHARRSGARASLGDRRGGVPRQPLRAPALQRLTDSSAGAASAADQPTRRASGSRRSPAR